MARSYRIVCKRGEVPWRSGRTRQGGEVRPIYLCVARYGVVSWRVGIRTVSLTRDIPSRTGRRYGSAHAHGASHGTEREAILVNEPREPGGGRFDSVRSGSVRARVRTEENGETIGRGANRNETKGKERNGTKRNGTKREKHTETSYGAVRV